MTYKECTRKTLERQFLLIRKDKIFEIFTSAPTMVAPQRYTKLNNLPAHPKKSWMRHWRLKLKLTEIKRVDLKYKKPLCWKFQFYYYSWNTSWKNKNAVISNMHLQNIGLQSGNNLFRFSWKKLFQNFQFDTFR